MKAHGIILSDCSTVTHKDSLIYAFSYYISYADFLIKSDIKSYIIWSVILVIISIFVITGRNLRLRLCILGSQRGTHFRGYICENLQRTTCIPPQRSHQILHCKIYSVFKLLITLIFGKYLYSILLLFYQICWLIADDVFNK